MCPLQQLEKDSTKRGVICSVQNRSLHLWSEILSRYGICTTSRQRLPTLGSLPSSLFLKTKSLLALANICMGRIGASSSLFLKFRIIDPRATYRDAGPYFYELRLSALMKIFRDSIQVSELWMIYL